MLSEVIKGSHLPVFPEVPPLAEHAPNHLPPDLQAMLILGREAAGRGQERGGDVDLLVREAKT